MKETVRHEITLPTSGDLFARVASILEQARGNVVRSVNANMVLAYWHIGREIVEEIQGGEERAEYGKQVLEQLSEKLTNRYGTGFSIANLKNFRQFYLIYPNRLDGIRYPVGSESEGSAKPSHPGTEIAITKIGYPTGSEFPQCFSPLLSWSHYRALMRVQDDRARLFYEQESIECGWSKSQLERQIHSSYYRRIIANRGKAGLLPVTRERLQGEPVPAEQRGERPGENQPFWRKSGRTGARPDASRSRF